MVEGDFVSSAHAVNKLVEHFYEQVRRDELLAPVFNDRVGNNWSGHLAVMKQFWRTILLDTAEYRGEPMTKHQALPLSPDLFVRWLQLFNQAADIHLRGKVRTDAKQRARNIAAVMQYKLVGR